VGNTTWLEISLVVDGELAEAVAEVLARYASNGVAIESTAVTANPDDSEGHAVGPLRVCGYLPVDAQVEETRQRIEEALWYLGRIRPLPAAQFRTLQEDDWAEAWKEHYKPILIGRSLVVVPAWLETPDPQRIAIRMDPGMAFGTGTHPTTQLCLEFIENELDSGSRNIDQRSMTSDQEPGLLRSSVVIRPSSIIDVGCGSGILAVAALKLGVKHALGVDIDAESITASLENGVLNGVGERFEVGLGSVAEVRAGQFGIQRAPLVVANILAPVIIRLMDDGLGDLVAPAGLLVLSGILQEQAGDVIQALEGHGFQVSGQRQIGDWVGLSAQRTPAA
jgi:ribosomal protein L11 methyltransferase